MHVSVSALINRNSRVANQLNNLTLGINYYLITIIIVFDPISAISYFNNVLMVKYHIFLDKKRAY